MTRPFIGRLRASRWIAIAGALLGLVVAISLVLAARAVYRTADVRNNLVDRLYPAEAAYLRFAAALVDEETGVHGYALSGRAESLRPYVEGRERERRALAELRRLARSPGAPVTSLPADLTIVERRAEAWRAAYAEPLIAEIAHDPDRTATGERIGTGRALFDGVRGALRELEAGIVDARDEGRERLRDAVRDLTLSLVVVGAAVVAAALALGLAVRRGISDPLARLRSEVRAVASGDLDHSVRGEGPADVLELGDDVESMRRRLVAELAAVEEARAQIERQARQLERSNAELEQFAFVAAHDLQEPLRRVASFCQLLQRRYADQLDERAEQYIAFAVDGAKRMQTLISDLLTFSELGRTELVMRPVGLSDALHDALDNVRRRIHLTGARIVAEPLPTVMGDRRLLATVFENLISNALKFHGGSPPVIHVGARSEDDRIVVSVRDEGIGIDPQFAERVFAVFARLHPREAYEGTGIGLALARKIVEHHGGRIWLDTASGDGTTFLFTIPVRGE